MCPQLHEANQRTFIPLHYNTTLLNVLKQDSLTSTLQWAPSAFFVLDHLDHCNDVEIGRMKRGTKNQKLWANGGSHCSRCHRSIVSWWFPPAHRWPMLLNVGCNFSCSPWHNQQLHGMSWYYHVMPRSCLADPIYFSLTMHVPLWPVTLIDSINWKLLMRKVIWWLVWFVATVHFTDKGMLCGEWSQNNRVLWAATSILVTFFSCKFWALEAVPCRISFNSMMKALKSWSVCLQILEDRAHISFWSDWNLFLRWPWLKASDTHLLGLLSGNPSEGQQEIIFPVFCNPVGELTARVSAIQSAELVMCIVQETWDSAYATTFATALDVWGRAGQWRRCLEILKHTQVARGRSCHFDRANLCSSWVKDSSCEQRLEINHK